MIQKDTKKFKNLNFAYFNSRWYSPFFAVRRYSVSISAVTLYPFRTLIIKEQS